MPESGKKPKYMFLITHLSIIQRNGLNTSITLQAMGPVSLEASQFRSAESFSS